MSDTLWTGRARSRGLVLLSAGFSLVLGAVGAGTVIALSGSGAPTWAGWLVAVVGLLVGILGWLLSSLEVRLTLTSFTVAFGPLGLPRRVIAVADIADASAVLVEPMDWGGWGYRWIPRANASAAVLWRGPGIALVLRDDRRFAVTVGDAVAGAQATSAALTAAARG